MRLLLMNIRIIFFAALFALSSCVSVLCQQPNDQPPGEVLFRKFDEIGISSWSDEKARLDNVALTLKEAPSNAVVYLLAYAGRIACVDAANARNVRAKNHLVTKRGIAPGRVIVINGGYREKPLLEVWILPSDISRPEPNPTLDRSQVRLKNCTKRTSVHRQRA